MKYLYAVLSCFFLASCGGIDGQKYQEVQPEFKLEEYFDGNIKAWGIVQDFSGNVTRRFEADIIASWDGNKGVLDETFTFYDKQEKEKRVWKITKTGDKTYTGTAGDIIGIATGKSFGNAIQWTYEMDLPVDDTTYRLTFDDWIWAMRDDVIINRSYLKKYGVIVAEITIFMQKQN